MEYTGISMKVYGYCRVSGPSQIDNDGLPRQEAAIRKICADRELELVKVFFDEDVSGTVEGMNRPAWVEMLAEMQQNDISCIVIEKLDRLARDLMISEYIIKDLQSRHYDLVSAYEPDLCSSDPTRKLMRQIMAAFAEYDKMMLVNRLRSARERKKARTGKCEGRLLYGEYPAEKDPLEYMKSLREGGMRWEDIAGLMNGAGIKTRFGFSWSRKMVYNVVSRVMITEREAA